MPTTAERAQFAVARGLLAAPRSVQRAIAGKPVRVDGLELDLEAQLLLKLLDSGGEDTFETFPPAEARERIAADAEAVAGPPTPMRRVEDRTVAGRPARLYVPAAVEHPMPLLVAYHGGGHVIGGFETHEPAWRFVAREAQVAVLAIDYRLAPEDPFPAAVDDCLAAFRFAAERAAHLDVDPQRIAVGGDSAGGNLAAVVAQLAHQDADGPQPAFQWLMYPMTDLTTRRPSRDLFAEGFFLTEQQIQWYTGHYVPDPEQVRDPRVSPGLTEDLSGLAPAYVATAGFDPLRDEGEEYARRLREAGVQVTARRFPGLVHGFVNATDLGDRAAAPMVEACAALRWGLAGRP